MGPTASENTKNAKRSHTHTQKYTHIYVYLHLEQYRGMKSVRMVWYEILNLKNIYHIIKKSIIAQTHNTSEQKQI